MLQVRKCFEKNYISKRTFTARFLYNSRKILIGALKKKNKTDPQTSYQPFLYLTHNDGSSNDSDIT